MYSKCSSLEAAREIFVSWPCKDVVLWTSLVSSYAENGRGQESLHLFQSMQLDGINPDQVTFIAILSKCAQAGLLHAAHTFFSCIPDHGLVPALDHYVCLADALGRSGWIEQASELLDLMPYEPDAAAWTSLLSACNVHHHTTSSIGGAAALRALSLHPSDGTPYLLLSNLRSQTVTSVVQSHSS
ncbi:hypothetical protein SELMODRAFT_75659 [Selaginella moellendorffii]|uniref:Pentacotripeptide-repeat region of PRORP domain-containing protein n=1 Tax=Selaginella moellendorffii TaxID=88036 RepID=D8QPN1_SELML|nr:hypothetical protein SELMODRAFT_75659 [Selaginella moellendorffii]